MDSSKHTFQEIAHLILLSRYGKAEKWQILELEEWLKKSEENRNFYDKVLSRSYLEEGLEEYIQYDADDAWKQLKTKMHPRKRRFLVRVFPYVAILVVIIGLVFLWQTQDSEPIQRERVMTAILPGSSKAQLVLSNGRQIELEAKNDRLCRRVEGENFENTGELLDYRRQGSTENTVQIHTLRIPRGGEYQIILSDSTRVWVNADSELQYPDHFMGDKRKVVLKGEAYFEVAKDTSHPFYVEVGDMNVKVLGTSFNISAYPNSKRQTTLVEGCVTINWNQQQVMLHPGQQATENIRELQVREVNVANYVGWIDRRFVFKDKLLGEVLEDLERWYDVEIFVTDDKIRNLHFTANFQKYENMDKVLKIIEYAACVKFEIKDRTLVVRLD